MKPAQHEIENRYIVSMVSALYGAISSNLRAVTLSDATETAVTFHFLLGVESQEDRDEIEDIIFEFEALQNQAIDCNAFVHVGQGFEHFKALPGRGIFHRKELV